MHHPLPNFGRRALPTLQAGGLLLLPTANLWQLCAKANHPDAVRRLLLSCPPSKFNRPELLFTDPEVLFHWCPRIHPRLHTLLSYHKRPLTLLVPAGPRVPLALIDDKGEVAVRVAMDSFVHRLCEDLEVPLASSMAVGPGASELPTSFGKVRSDVLEAAQHTVRRRQRETLGKFRAVSARFGDDGEIEFLR